MNPERWQELDNLFHSALQRVAGERAAFLDEACGGDDSLRKQVEALLAAHEAAAGFIESPAFEAEARQLAIDEAEENTRPSVGQTLGHRRFIPKPPACETQPIRIYWRASGSTVRCRTCPPSRRLINARKAIRWCGHPRSDVRFGRRRRLSPLIPLSRVARARIALSRGRFANRSATVC